MCITLSILVKLDVLTKEIQESGSAINQSAEFPEVTRKASLTTPQLPSVHINNAGQYEQQKQLYHEALKLNPSLLEREHCSLPETSTPIKPVETTRPYSDTDVTTLSLQEQDDLMSSIKCLNLLHIKGGEKIVLEEPCYEGLSVSIDSYNQYGCDEEIYDPYPSMIPEEIATTPSFYIPDVESPTTPLVDIPSPYLMPTEATQTAMPSRKLVGSSTDLSYYLKNG